MSKVSVRIDSSRPIFIEADADNFGQVFAAMSDEDQVNVLRAMVEHMKPHQIQWDYISIALEKDENLDVRDQLSVILPDIAAKDAEIAKLTDLIRWAHDTLYEINPSNYDHDEVCKLNDASVEVILGLAPALGERHGKSAEWWAERAKEQANV